MPRKIEQRQSDGSTPVRFGYANLRNIRLHLPKDSARTVITEIAEVVRGAVELKAACNVKPWDAQQRKEDLGKEARNLGMKLAEMDEATERMWAESLGDDGYALLLKLQKDLSFAGLHAASPADAVITPVANRSADPWHALLGHGLARVFNQHGIEIRPTARKQPYIQILNSCLSEMGYSDNAQYGDMAVNIARTLRKNVKS